MDGVCKAGNNSILTTLLFVYIHSNIIMLTKTIKNLFLDTVELYPNNTAISWNDQQISYHQLYLASHQLGIYFLNNANQQNNIVAIIAKRTPCLVASILACSQVGLCFLVLDSSYPKTHIKKILANIKPALLVGIDCSEIVLKDYVDSQSGIGIYVVDNDLTTYNSAFKSFNNHHYKVVSDEQVAYLLMTSGSTGEPKCIQTAHAPLIHFVEWYAKQFSVQAGDKFSMLSGLSHDPLLRDIFVPLACGAVICIPNQETLLNNKQLFDWVCNTQITFCHITPQLLRILCANSQPNGLPKLKFVMSGGDALKQAHYNDLLKLSPNCQLVNFYGSTETPQAMSFYCLNSIKSIQDPIPVGYAIDDVKLKIFDADLNEVANGVEGQIAIETQYLSLGYLPETAATITPFFTLTNSQENNSHVKTYLTGDYGYKLLDGALVVGGRLDDQVKIRGFRVELNAVLKAIESTNPSLNAIVLAQKMQNQENCLVAFCEISKIHNVSATESIKAQLGNCLPSYMQPQQYIWLEKLPLLPNGKTNRAALFEIFLQKQCDEFDDNNEDVSLEKNFISEWQHILGVEKIGLHQSFNLLGGDSLSFIQAAVILEKELGYIPDNWENLTISQIKKITKKSYHYSLVSTTILIRALSIVLIVLDHLYSYNIALTTTVLLMVSGASLAKYQFNQLNGLLDNLNLNKNILKIVLPTLLVSAIIQILKGELHWPSLLFITNFVDPTFDYIVYYWFIYVLIQIMFIMMLLFFFNPIKKLFIQNKFNFCIYATLISIFIALYGAFKSNKGYPFNALPHILIWQVFLGMAITYAASNKQKIIVLMIIFLTTIGAWLAEKVFTWFPLSGFLIQLAHNVTPWFPLFAVSLILYVPNIKLSFLTSRAINLVARSSLFIYIVHWPLANYLSTMPYFPKGLRLALITIVFGVLISAMWDKMSPTLYKKISKVSLAKIKLSFNYLK